MPAAAPADLGETESVSEDELPLDSEKKKKSGTKTMSKTLEKKNKIEGTSKRKEENVYLTNFFILYLNLFTLCDVHFYR